MKNTFDLIIIGSGPAGLAAAVAASRRGMRTLLLEQMPGCGRKLLASGGGKCNVTNVLKPADMASRFGRGARFVRHALHTYPAEELKRYFAGQGVPLELTDGFHYFPRSLKATDILHALLDDAVGNGCAVKTGCRVDGVLGRDKAVCGVTVSGEEFYAPQVVIAAGGKSYPALGGSVSGYKLAKDMGHNVVPPLPAMVGLQCKEAWVKECAGISLPDVESRIALPKEKFRCRGELLFTHTGISAFAVLDISGRVSELLEQHKSVPMKLDLMPQRSEDEWRKLFGSWQKKSGNVSVSRLLSEDFPRRLMNILCPQGAMKAAQFPGSARDEFIKNATALELNITATDGWDKAMVTRGGVALDEVDIKTLESRIVRGLYFAGEVLDVDGPCGGYNISWALASGFLVGNMIGEKA